MFGAFATNISIANFRCATSIVKFAKGTRNFKPSWPFFALHCTFPHIHFVSTGLKETISKSIHAYLLRFEGL